MYVSGERPSRQAWRSVRKSVLEGLQTMAKTIVLAALAWWLPRWFLPACVVLACALAFLSTPPGLWHSAREWLRIRSHVARLQAEKLVDDVHDR